MDKAARALAIGGQPLLVHHFASIGALKTVQFLADGSPSTLRSVIVCRMKPILLEIVNRLSEMGASLGALEAALIHTRQLTTGDVRRLLDGHKANVEAQLAQLRTAIAALPD